MKKLALLLCLCLVIGALFSCGDKGNDGGNANGGNDAAHTHTYEDTWSSDVAGHWYNLTCDCDEDVTKIEHTDKNNDGACDICEFSNHKHTYSEDWTADCTYHWNAASCGHIIAGANKAEHDDADEDGKCDECNYIIEDIHTHVYATEWTYENGYHYHAALCEHASVIADKTACTANEAGFCTVCNGQVFVIDENDLGAIIAAAAAQRDHVTSGTFKFHRGGDLPVLDNHTYFTLGNNGSYMRYVDMVPGVNEDGISGIYYTTYHRWYELLADSDIFAVQSEGTLFEYTNEDGENEYIAYANPSEITVYASTAEQMEGPYYQLSDLELNNHYVLEEVLLALYNMYTSDLAREKDINFDPDNNKVHFNCGYLVVNEVQGSENAGGSQGEGENSDRVTETVYLCKYYTIDVSFTYTDAFEIIEATMSVGAYTDQQLQGDNGTIAPDFSYNHETGEVIWSGSQRSDDYSIMVSQVVGERTYTTAYPKEAIVPQSFELFYNDQPINGTLEIVTGVTAHFVPGKLVPITAEYKFLDASQIRFSLINNATGMPCEYNVWYFDGTISVFLTEDGSYTLHYSYGEMQKSIQINSSTPVPASVETHVFYEESGWGSTWLEVNDNTATTSVTVNVGETVYITARVLPTICGATWRYIGQNTTWATLEGVMVFNESLESYDDVVAFTANAAGTYTITFVCSEKTSIRTTFTVTVVDPTAE